MNCILCTKELLPEDATEEHVFQAAIGGTVSIPAVHKSCNNASSDNFEQDIAKKFEHFRYLAGIEDRYGKLPTLQAEFAADGYEFNGAVLKNGEITLKPVIRDEIVDGKKERVFKYLPKKEAENLRRKSKERGDILTEEPQPEIEGELNFGGNLEWLMGLNMLRYVTKIAYVGFAEKFGASAVQSSEYEPVREFIKSGTGPSPARIFYNEGYFNSCGKGAHQHALTVSARRDIKRVDVIVHLFGGLTYFITLSDQYQGIDLWYSLVLDAREGTTNTTFHTHLIGELAAIEDVLQSKKTFWNHPIASEKFLEFFASRIRTNVPTRLEIKTAVKEEEEEEG